MQITTSRFLRRVLVADAATCIASGLMMTLGSSLLGQFLGVPPKLLRYAGIALFPFAAFLVHLASRHNLWSSTIWTVIVLNALWTADSFLLFVTGWTTPTQVGYAFISAQALGVAAFAGLEYLGLKKSAMVAI